MKKILFLSMCMFMMLCGGCAVFARLGTESSHEAKVEAEYDITEYDQGKILVLVRQPYLLEAQVNLRYHLSERINKVLLEKLKLPAKRVISYDELSQFRSESEMFVSLSPREAGRAIGAQLVLLVMVKRYEIEELPEPGYYSGYFETGAKIIDVSSGKLLWPADASRKTIRVGFDLETGGSEKAMGRLMAANVHCMIRYLYDSPRKFFKIADDRSVKDWHKWTQ